MHHRTPRCRSLSIIAGLTFAAASAQADSVSVNLSDWTQAGATKKSKWKVTDNGNSVLKTKNGGPSYFLSPDSYINTRFTGTIGVDTWSDDDFIGFVFGWQEPQGAEPTFLALHWKQSLQNGSDAGFTLAEVDGPGTPPSHQAQKSSPGYDVLSSNTGPDLGWQDNTRYGFELDFARTNIRLVIKDLLDENGLNSTQQFGLQGTEVINIAGNFSEGRFGFYNQSQTKAYYGDLRTQELEVVSPLPFLDPKFVSVEPAVVPAPAASTVGLIACVGLVARRRRRP